MQSQNDTNQVVPESKYAQLVTSVISQYDATLIFYQSRPEQVDKCDIQKFKSQMQEVARVTLPHKALSELKEVLVRQAEEVSREAKPSKKTKKSSKIVFEK